MKRRALFIGRFQPFHAGHKWLIQQALDKGEPVLVAVMMMPMDENNPYPWGEIVWEIQRYYWNLLNADVVVIAIPPIASVNYGRDVGWDIREHVPPPEIAAISGTEIRKEIGEPNEVSATHRRHSLLS